eukprot:768712-Hanusia_phi.AAC.3
MKNNNVNEMEQSKTILLDFAQSHSHDAEISNLARLSGGREQGALLQTWYDKRPNIQCAILFTDEIRNSAKKKRGDLDDHGPARFPSQLRRHLPPTPDPPAK